MVKRSMLNTLTLLVLFLLSASVLAQQETTIFTDADAGVKVICRQDVVQEECDEPRGTADNIIDDWSDHPRYIRVHDQNDVTSGYWHFDLSGVDAGAQVTEARFQLDAQSNSWGDTTVAVFAIADPARDWDLNDVPESEIYGGNAPQADWSDWEDDPDNAQRFNPPTPFLDEGSSRTAVVRELEIGILVENQDAFTEGTQQDPGNEYGGYGCCDGEGTAGSADAGDNIWPTKDAVDVDITELVQWKLGQNPNYSSFAPEDRELTLLVRTDFPEFGGENGFARFVSKESEFLGGEEDLAPGRIVITGSGITLPGDFDSSGVLDLPDVNMLNMKIADGMDDAAFDLNADGAVNRLDLGVWVRDLRVTWFGDANLNGSFNTADLVTVFQVGKFEQDVDAGWEEGDWTGDLRFGTGDLVAAFQDGGFEAGPRAAVSAVPEPSGLGVLLLGLAAFSWLGRCRR